MEPKHIEVLLIEDNPGDAELVIRSLKKHQFDKHLVHVQNGVEAMKYLFSENSTMPKLIIADLKMPLVDGFDILKKIKSDEKKKIIPIVILTSSKEDRDIQNAYKLGVNAYIVKPVDYHAFTNTILQIASFWLQLNQPPIM